MVNGKAKGATAEREVAKILEKYWRQLEPDIKVYRTPGSGAWASSHGANQMAVASDLMVDPNTCKRWPFAVEIKHRKTITLKAIDNFIDGKKSSILKYWSQCLNGAKRDNLPQPLLVFRGNRMPWYVAYLRDPYDDVPGREEPTEYVVITMEEFLKIPPESFALPVGADRS